MDTTQYIKERLLSDLGNRQFAAFLDQDVKSDDDVIWASSESQVGKSLVLKTALWLSRREQKRWCFVITNNSIADVTQLEGDIKGLNESITKHLQRIHKGRDAADYTLDWISSKQLKGEALTEAVKRKKIMLFLLNANHLNKLDGIIEECLKEAGDNYGVGERPVHILVDEGDLWVAKSKTQKEWCYDTIMKKYGSRIKISYITATPLPLMNSIKRNVQRQMNLHEVPKNMYEEQGYHYRGFSHPSNQFNVREIVAVIKNIDTASPELQRRFSEEILSQLYTPPNERQPRIVLIDVANINGRKDLLAKYIKRIVGHQMHVCIFTGPGVQSFDDLGNSETSRKGIDIGTYLSELKANGHPNTVPILIFATKKATRAQVYRDKDRHWKLTDWIYHCSSRTDAITRIQAARPNGQYAHDAPRTTYWMTAATLEGLKSAVQWNRIFIEKAVERPNTNLWKILEDISGPKVKYPLTRSGINNFKISGKTRCWPWTELKTSWQTLAPHIRDWKVVTERHVIRWDEFMGATAQSINFAQMAQRKNWTPGRHLSFPNGSGSGIQKSFSEAVRSYIELKRFTVPQVELKIGLITTDERDAQLSPLDCLKKGRAGNLNFDVIVGPTTNPEWFSVVIYHQGRNFNANDETFMTFWHKWDGQLWGYNPKLPERGNLQRPTGQAEYQADLENTQAEWMAARDFLKKAYSLTDPPIYPGPDGRPMPVIGFVQTQDVHWVFILLSDRDLSGERHSSLVTYWSQYIHDNGPPYKAFIINPQLLRLIARY